MFKRNKVDAVRRERHGLVSHVLLDKGDVPGGKMAVTWVDRAAGASQRGHKHEAEQVYVILKGRGLMRVGEEEQEVMEGDLVHIPCNVTHGIRNVASETLVYVSVSTPAFHIRGYYDTGKL
jgi:mannose-6-phosphate isomerase-like protein (cupin superfamily)